MSYLEQEAKAQKAAGATNDEIQSTLRISQAKLESLLMGESVVRVIVPPPNDRDLLRAMQYAGYVDVLREDAEGMCFDILPPRTYQDSDRWAENVAQYMVTLGYNAVRAPRWKA